MSKGKDLLLDFENRHANALYFLYGYCEVRKHTLDNFVRRWAL